MKETLYAHFGLFQEKILIFPPIKKLNFKLYEQASETQPHNFLWISFLKKLLEIHGK